MTIDEIKRQMFIDSEEVCGNTMIDTYSAQEYVERAYNKAIDDAKSVILQTLDNEILVDTLHLRLEQLKAGGENENYNKEES